MEAAVPSASQSNHNAWPDTEEISRSHEAGVRHNAVSEICGYGGNFGGENGSQKSKGGE